MFTTESKLFFGIAAFAALAAIVYAIASGDRMGSLLLVAALLAAGLVGLLLIGRPVPAEVAVPPGQRAQVAKGATAASELIAPNAWPAVAGVAILVLLIGIAGGLPMRVLGGAALAFAAGGWLLEVWREHVRQARPSAVDTSQRLLRPAGLPLLAILTIALVVVSVSRVLLAVPETASVLVALVAAAGILVVAFLVAARPRLSGRALSTLLGVIAVAVVLAGVWAASVGQRRVEAERTAKVVLTARGTAFTKSELDVPSDGHVVINFRNEDKDVQHNVAVYRDPNHTQVIYAGAVFPGLASRTYSFRSPGVGTYYYRCDMHPLNMLGTLKIEQAAGRHESTATKG